MELRITIPGEPHGMKRPRAVRFKRGDQVLVRTHTDAKSGQWKAAAQEHMARAMEMAGFPAGRPAFPWGPVAIEITAVYTLPTSKWKKREPVARCWYDGHRGGDWDNVGKAVCDAGNGVLWTDDCQVAVAMVRRIRGAQGEAPSVTVRVFVAPGKNHYGLVDGAA